MLIKKVLSPVYGHLLPKPLLSLDVANESFADCRDCQLCTNVNHTRYDSKCCDYHPFIPNYMVGAILADESPELNEGKHRIKTKIINKIGVTPYGIQPSLPYVQFRKEYQNRRKNNIMVAKEEVDKATCPYLMDGLCTVYRYRSDLCPVWFCGHRSGEYGKSFWQDLTKYTFSIEKTLRVYAMRKIGYPEELIKLPDHNPEHLDLHNADGSFNNEAHRKLWDKWYDHIERFYVECFDSVMNIDQKYVESLRDHNTLLTTMLNKAREMSDNIIPDRLVLDRENIHWIKLSNGGSIKHESKELNIDKLQSLAYKMFNGHNTTKYVFRKASLMKIEVLPYLKSFMKLGILIPADSK